MTKLTTELLEKFVSDIKTDGMCDITDHQVALALRQLLAYEQADKTTDLKTLVISEIVDFYSGFESPGEPETVDEAQRQLIGRVENVFGLAAPVLPKQPEFYTKPDRFLPKSLKPEEISGERRNSRIAELMGWFDRYYSGKANPKWLKSHVAELCYYILTVPQLSAQPVSEPYKLPDNLDFDCEFENGDYDIDEEPWLRGRVDGFNEALQIIKRSLNAKQNSTAQESE